MKSSDSTTLWLAHSPDPDDVFMWWPITGMVDPADHSRLVSPPELDTEGLRFRALAADIQVLNRRAVDVGDLDITAVSINAYARAKDRYQLTSFGSSMGDGYGPRVVVRATAAHGIAGKRPEDAGELSPGMLELLRSADMKIAVPGVETTAFLLLSMMLGQGQFRLQAMPFDQILPAVVDPTSATAAGVLIHQTQLTYGEHGVLLAVDLGQWWSRATGMPLPLGGNVVRRDLDQRHGAGTKARVARLMHASLLYAMKHRDRSVEYCMGFAPELSRAQAERYIDMYVSPLTVDLGKLGLSAIQRLLDEGARLGLCPAPGTVDLLRP